MTVKRVSVNDGDVLWRDGDGGPGLFSIIGDETTDPAPANFIVSAHGRLSTKSKNGAAISVPDAYTFGEMWELRYTFNESGNSQRQGVFMDVRTAVANSSTVRGFEISAQSEGDINIGTLSGGTTKAIPRGEAGTITNLFGGEAEVTFNDSDWAGTVTQLAGHRTKVSLEDGGTYTNSSVYLAEVEAITGADVIGSYYRAKNASGITANALIDATGCPLTVVDTDKVNLIKFRDSGGDEVILRVANDGTVSVAAA